MSLLVSRQDALLRAGKYADGAPAETVKKPAPPQDDAMLQLVRAMHAMIAQIPVLLDRQNAQHTQAMTDMMTHMMATTKHEVPAPTPVNIDVVGEEWEMTPIRDASGRTARATFKRIK